ncbi:cyclophilin-like fold protein [Intrasporangium sp.]|uniref:cyclophilin-like fold protein n=1 Tax=Intrasporangium sp. TaxID=1925024 RepID=UPI0032217380
MDLVDDTIHGRADHRLRRRLGQQRRHHDRVDSDPASSLGPHHRRQPQRHLDRPGPAGTAPGDPQLPQPRRSGEAGRPRPPVADGGGPSGDDPEIDDLGYYAPNARVVLYTTDVGRYEGIVRIGRIAAAVMAWLAQQPDGFQVTIERG